MLQAVKVKPLPGYRLWIAYEDGVCGEIDLSDIVGKGVFKAWEEPGFFEKVHISQRRTIAWNDDLDVCADALYMELTGKSVDEVFPRLKSFAQSRNA